MNDIIVPKSYNYISAFLTFNCNMNCGYCINKVNGLYKYSHMGYKDWINGLARLETDLAITFSGGEPTVYKDFYKVVDGLNMPMDLLTNGQFDRLEFMRNVGCRKFKRDTPYANIRFSYHPGYTNLFRLLSLTKRMKDRGYSVGIWAVCHPDSIDDVMFAKKKADSMGLDFRLKEYLGYHNDKLYGSYKYPEMLKEKDKIYTCRPSELLIAPDGRLFRCHNHLYSGENSYGHILDIDKLPEDFVRCETKTACNMCDLKRKFNRFQVEGHCAVEIKEIKNEKE